MCDNGARITKLSNGYLIILTINDHVSFLRNFKRNLMFLTRCHHGIRIKNGFYIEFDVNSVLWRVTEKYLWKVFTDLSIKIIVCNQIITSLKSERTSIITENHSTTIGRYKAVLLFLS